MYGPAIREVVKWLEKAAKVADTPEQEAYTRTLIEYYNTGDLALFDRYNVAWVQDTASTVDYVNGFIETYGDPLGYKASWESTVNFKDFEATKTTQIISDNAQWFEDHSPIDSQYRKPKVKGVSAKVITVAMLGGDCYPSTPIGINLPNADWIRRDHGSKSVTIANITAAYDAAAAGNGFAEEFILRPEDRALRALWGTVGNNLHTDLHECLGHGSGQLAEGVRGDELKNYGSTLEEARADLFALYYMNDPKMVELGVIPTLDVAKAEYNNYMAGTGHHCFITAGDELWILYHCFYNPEDNNDNEGNFLGRCIGADRLYWKYTPELGYDMLYGNGPTYNLQPKPETFTGYTNVAKYATIEGNGDFGEVSYLTDGLFTSQPFTRHWEYGSDEGLLKIKLTWDTPVEIRSFHIYNSGSINYAFKNVSSVMFKLAEKPAWYTGPETQYCYIKDLPTFADDYFTSERVVRKGAAAMAEFEPMTVTEMTICISVTLDNDNKYTYLDDVTFDNEFCGVRVSELYIMGNPVNE